MQTRLDCLVCFMRQALATARLCSEDTAVQRRVVDEAGRLLSRVDLALSPPENAVELYAMISRITGHDDPFATLKEESNRFALKLRQEVAAAIARARDPLRAAVRFAACGNIIDYAAQHSFDAAGAMDSCEEQQFVVDDFPAFTRRMHAQNAPVALYLADNCGELVFDGLLIEQLKQQGCEVVLAVRGGPIINDATQDDVRACGLDGLCRVIDSGVTCPGTPLAQCSEEFRQCFDRADLIISKGMGNFETLSDVQAPIFFLFMVKCERVALHLRDAGLSGPEGDIAIGDMVFMQQSKVL